MVLRAKQVSGDDQQQKSEPSLKCPRCGSTNTKFCYYNNYNKSQPRHFCKSCKRHWTKDGTLRNVPVGGGGRKNKRRPSISKSPVKIVNSTVPSKNIAVSDQKHCSGFSSFIAGLCADRDKGMSHNNNNNFLYHGVANQSSSSSLLHNVADGIKNIRDPCNDASRTGMNVPVETKIDPVLFSSSDLSTFDEKDSLIINRTTYQSMNVHTDPCFASVHTIEESIVTSVDIPSTSTISPWPETTSSSALDLPSYWNWSEIDALSNNQDDLDISWADVDRVIKP